MILMSYNFELPYKYKAITILSINNECSRFILHLCTKLNTKAISIGSGNYEFKYEIIMISLKPTKRRQFLV